MAQELTVNTWCDVCLAMGEHEEAEPTPPVNGRILDLCKAHWEERVQPLLDALADYGRRPDTTPARPVKRTRTPTPEVGEGEGFECPLCGHLTATPTAMGQHFKQRHETTIVGVFGSVCPVCGEESGHLGNHAAKAHGLSGGMGAFRWAEANGDPHGVVAEARKRWAKMR